MNYFLLAETEFFRRINEAGDCNMETAYTAFATQVIELCSGNVDTNRTIIALAYIEIELQHHPVRNLPEEKREVAAYISKALSFVRKMQKFLAAPQRATTNPHPYILRQHNRKSRLTPAMDGQRHRPRGTYLRHQRDGLHQQRQHAAQTARPAPLQDFRGRIKGLLPLLYRHQTPEKRKPHLFP